MARSRYFSIQDILANILQNITNYRPSWNTRFFLEARDIPGTKQRKFFNIYRGIMMYGCQITKTVVRRWSISDLTKKKLTEQNTWVVFSKRSRELRVASQNRWKQAKNVFACFDISSLQYLPLKHVFIQTERKPTALSSCTTLSTIFTDNSINFFLANLAIACKCRFQRGRIFGSRALVYFV